jgi:hypothetical protein
MCWVCNPYCGRCKPPQPKPRQCSECGAYQLDPQKEKCKKCGGILPAHKPPPIVNCGYSGLVCANPCGKARKSADEYQICKQNTPPPPGAEVTGWPQSPISIKAAAPRGDGQGAAASRTGDNP